MGLIVPWQAKKNVGYYACSPLMIIFCITFNLKLAKVKQFKDAYLGQMKRSSHLSVSSGKMDVAKAPPS